MEVKLYCSQWLQKVKQWFEFVVGEIVNNLVQKVRQWVEFVVGDSVTTYCIVFGNSAGVQIWL